MTLIPRIVIQNFRFGVVNILDLQFWLVFAQVACPRYVYLCRLEIARKPRVKITTQHRSNDAEPRAGPRFASLHQSTSIVKSRVSMLGSVLLISGSIPQYVTVPSTLWVSPPNIHASGHEP